jgi:adenosylhomocysteine nucleosidase
LEDTVKTGIVVACEIEYGPLKPYLQNSFVTEYGGYKIHEFRAEGHEIAFIVTGLGKVNMALGAQTLLNIAKPDILLLCGVGGAMISGLNIADVVLIDEAVCHDLDYDLMQSMHPFKLPRVYKSDEHLVSAINIEDLENELNCKVIKGRTATGDKFVANEGRQEIIETFNPVIVDMETASAAQAAYMASIPFLAIRGISDTPDNTGEQTFLENCERASVTAWKTLFALLNLIDN